MKTLETVKEYWIIAKWGLKSRLILLLLQALLHNLIPDHTGSMEDVFMKAYRSPEHPFLVERLLGGLDNWDAEYFIFNTHSGYEKHERTMAFFPLLPLAMRTLSNTIFLPLGFLFPQRSIGLISGVFINLLVFPLATVVLYVLTFELSGNKKLSLLTAILFTLNPASVFMSAVYSETLFSLFTFSGLLALERRRPWLSSLMFGLASFTRSNGIVLSAFLGYQSLVSLYEIFFSHGHQSTCHRLWSSGKQLFAAAIQCLVIVAPFYAFQLYGYALYCRGASATPTSLPPWCNRTLPLPYSYIQEHYWSVGFLRYYQWKQLPNFMLASPMVLLGLFSIWSYFTGGSFSFGIRAAKNSRTEHENRTQAVRTVFPKSIRLRPYVLHLLILLVFGIFNMHIQVLTRFICSSSPLIYWISACQILQVVFRLGASEVLNTKHFSVGEIIKTVVRALFGGRLVGKRRSEEGKRGDIWISQALVIYFGAYIVLGFTLHCNFYPWT